jgi:YD repeat-containing protein
MVYNLAGEQTASRDELGHLSLSTFNSRGWQTALTDARGKVTTYLYDAVSREVSTTDRLGRRRDFTYDGANRQTGEVWKDAGGATVNTLTFTYDADNNQLTAADQNGTYTFTFDALDRVGTQRGPFGLTLTYGYDAVSNRTSEADSLGGRTTSTYNAANLLTSRQFTGSGGPCASTRRTTPATWSRP